MMHIFLQYKDVFLVAIIIIFLFLWIVNKIKIKNNKNLLREWQKKAKVADNELQHTNSKFQKINEENGILKRNYATSVHKLNTFENNLKQISNEKNMLKQNYETSIYKLNIFENNLKKMSGENNMLKQNNKDIADKLSDSKNNFGFISALLNAKLDLSKKTEKITAFNSFLKLLNDDYRGYANKNDALAEEAQALDDLEKVKESLKLIVANPELHKKHIIAVAGGFSAGKSEFINTLLKFPPQLTLPIMTKPTTAIPTYVVSGPENRIIGHSEKGGKITIPTEFFKSLTREKIDQFSFNITELLPYITIDIPLADTFKHLCFIDTPGYNPGSKTEEDRQASLDFIKKADAVIWVINIESGTISPDDIEILEDVINKYPNKKIFIVCNKADLKPETDVRAICKEIAEQLKSHEIPYSGIVPYSAAYPDENTKYNQEVLYKFLQSLNFENKNQAQNLIFKVRDVFVSYIKADRKKIKEFSDYKKNLNDGNAKILEKLTTKDIKILKYEAEKSWEDFDEMDSLGLDSLANENVSKDEDINEDEKEIELDFFNYTDPIIKNYSVQIEKYKRDEKKARELCKKMQSCIANIFDIKLADIKLENNKKGLLKQAIKLEDKYNKYNKVNKYDKYDKYHK